MTEYWRFFSDTNLSHAVEVVDAWMQLGDWQVERDQREMRLVDPPDKVTEWLRQMGGEKVG